MPTGSLGAWERNVSSDRVEEFKSDWAKYRRKETNTNELRLKYGVTGLISIARRLGVEPEEKRFYRKSTKTKSYAEVQRKVKLLQEQLEAAKAELLEKSVYVDYVGRHQFAIHGLTDGEITTTREYIQDFLNNEGCRKMKDAITKNV